MYVCVIHLYAKHAKKGGIERDRANVCNDVGANGWRQSRAVESGKARMREEVLRCRYEKSFLIRPRERRAARARARARYAGKHTRQESSVRPPRAPVRGLSAGAAAIPRFRDSRRARKKDCKQQRVRKRREGRECTRRDT